MKGEESSTLSHSLHHDEHGDDLTWATGDRLVPKPK